VDGRGSTSRRVALDGRGSPTRAFATSVRAASGRGTSRAQSAGKLVIKAAFKGYKQACKRCDHEVAPVKLEQCDFDFSEPGMNQGAHDEVRCQRCQERGLNCVTGRALVGR